MKRIINFISSKPLVIGIVIIAVILSVVVIVWHNNLTNESDVSKMEYRTDEQPIIDRFPSLPTFQDCYWKANATGRTDIGPTNYWMKGFIILNKTSYEQILNEYTWESVSLEFSKGIDPTITNYEDFNWCYNKDFESRVKTTSFVGNFYLDTKNGILFFSVENS